jgi:hypothetical protein
MRTPVDAFLRQTLEKNGLAPAPPAGRLALLRRVHFDLVGLPPSPEEVGRFLRDERPDAYERLVDRLLASPHYGERWGRHWLDVARYADTGGFEQDYTYPNAWRYRDYVIRSFNADKPFDRFTREQVAGDELWPDDPEAVTATAMYCVGPVLGESAMIGSQLEYEWLTDAADATGSAFLGLTFGCARCHDHKFDPITQRDYYAMQAFFAASDRPYPDRVFLGRIKALNGLLSDAPVPKEFLNDPRCLLQTEDTTGFRLFHRREPMVVHRLHRGELGKEREVMEPAFPAALKVVDSGPGSECSAARPDLRRAELARWLTSPGHPLVARVLVNRVWGWHFGRAIVGTPNDFGAMGEAATHPELLDWLARDFVEHGWSLKHLHRRTLLSAAYQMASTAGGPCAEKDPEDRLLWRFPRRRLEAEAVRDAMLACSGMLQWKPFGPPVVPSLSKDELTGLFGAKEKWPVTRDPAEHSRRSVYLLVRRIFAHPLLAAFDPPEMMTSCPRRMETIVPTQALALLNSPVARQQAAAFGRRLARESGGDPSRAAARAWLLAFGRPITEAEARRAVVFLVAHPVGPASEAALTELALALFNANEFVYLD